MTKNNQLYLCFILSAMAVSTIFSGCKGDDDPKNPVPINPQEIITTVRIDLKDKADTLKTFFIQWRDPDGPGAIQPVIDTLKLDTGKTYEAFVTLLDETKNPIQNISDEVKEEQNVHQFFYTLSSTLDNRVSVTRKDKDDNNLPLGLVLEIATTAGQVPLSGKLNVKLSHYDGIPKTTSPSPESDVDIDIPVVLK